MVNRVVPTGTPDSRSPGPMRHRVPPEGSGPATAAGAGKPREAVVVTEVERKFEIREGGVLPDWLQVRGLAGVASVGHPEVYDLDATYFDTDDLRLLRNEITLRRRTGGTDAGWHLKLPAGSGARDEVRLPAGPSATRVPDELIHRVQVHLRGHEPVPVVRLRTRRAVQHLFDAAGDAIAEIAQDQVTAMSPPPPGGADGVQGVEGAASSVMTWSELEVELTGGSRALLDAITERLTAAGAVPGAAPSKLARALAGRLDESAAGTAPAPAVLPARTAGAVVLAHLADHVARLETNDPLVREDAPDAVHQMRVATRRLRSALATFRPLFDRQVTDPLRDELQWLGGVLGGARDAEVIRDHLRDLVAAQPAELVLGPVQARIVTTMNSRYRAAHDAVLAELDGSRYFALLDALDRLLIRPPLTDAAHGKRDKVLLPLVARSFARMRRLHDQALDEADPARHDLLLHEIRKAAKRARYAGEALAPAYGGPAKAWAARMEAVQEALGSHQDTVVIRDQIRQLGVAAHLDGENGFTYGLLHGLERARAAETERQYLAAWDDASRRKPHRWLKG